MLTPDEIAEVEAEVYHERDVEVVARGMAGEFVEAVEAEQADGARVPIGWIDAHWPRFKSIAEGYLEDLDTVAQEAEFGREFDDVDPVRECALFAAVQPDGYARNAEQVIARAAAFEGYLRGDLD